MLSSVMVVEANSAIASLLMANYNVVETMLIKCCRSCKLTLTMQLSDVAS